MPQRHELVTVRDGIRLATDIYLPAGAGPFPAILQRTPYGKLAERPVAYARWCATRGYDTIDWVVGRPWSDGRVAAAGSSYGAFAAFMAALSGHLALKAIVARVPA